MQNYQKKVLLVMDMDSTAIQIECIDEVAKLAGTGELVSAITESAMRGELDFEQSLRRRVGTLKGAPESILQQVREKLPLMPGLIETIKTLQQHGWKTAIASGGFTYFADYLKSLLNLDFAASNQFEIIDGTLTGNVKGSVVDAQYKANTLQKLAEEYNIPRKNTLAIGDGANDLAMMKVAGLGVAFHAKPKVQQQAQIVVNFADLTALLCLLSANDRILIHFGRKLMPSFDIVSEITMHEVRNAVENANRVLSTRYDFRGVEAVIELNEKSETVKVTTESDFQLEQLIEILIGAFVKTRH